MLLGDRWRISYIGLFGIGVVIVVLGGLRGWDFLGECAVDGVHFPNDYLAECRHWHCHLVCEVSKDFLQRTYLLANFFVLVQPNLVDLCLVAGSLLFAFG